MERIKMAFEYANRDTKSGELSKREYKIAMTALFGHCPDKWEMREIFQNSPNRAVSFAEFLQWVRKKGFKSDDGFIDAKTLFVLLDKDFKGYLSITDCYSAANETGLRVSKTMWRRAFEEMDQDKKGFVNLDELTILMNNSNISALVH